MACPLCNGGGTVPRGLHDHYAPILAKNNMRKCDKCSQKEAIPHNVIDLPESQRPRLEQFLRGGPFYCQTCYAATPPCDDCGWHVQPDVIADHFRKVHLD